MALHSPSVQPVRWIFAARNASLAVSPIPETAFARPIACVDFDDARDIACDQCSAYLARFERGGLHVDRPDARAFIVVEHRPIHRARHVIVRILGRRSHVDAIAECRNCIDRHFPIRPRRRAGRQWSIHFDGFFNSGTNAGHTLASIRACAAAVG